MSTDWQEEFDKEFPEIWSENYKKSHFGCHMNNSIKSFVQSLIDASYKRGVKDTKLNEFPRVYGNGLRDGNRMAKLNQTHREE
jgi:hypothetical protein